MSEAIQPSIRPEQIVEIRRLAHDLSNALEVVIQTSFLLGTVELDDSARQWLAMLDKGAKQATEINRKMREQLKGVAESESRASPRPDPDDGPRG